MSRNLINMTDEELYALFFADKETARQAFDEIYLRYSTKVYTYCLRILSNRDLAEDIFQETFLHFYESAKIEREMTNVAAFLFRIARNLSINEKQKKHHTFTTLEELNFPAIEENYDAGERVRLLEMALEMMPEKYKEALVLKEFVGMSYKEISEILNTSLATVRIRIYRAKNKIRELLLPYLEDYEK